MLKNYEINVIHQAKKNNKSGYLFTKHKIEIQEREI